MLCYVDYGWALMAVSGPCLDMSVILPELIEQLFNRLKARPTKQFEHREYLELKSLFDEVLDRALHLLDTAEITLYQSINNIGEILEIAGYGDEVRKILPDANYCSCDDFKINVVHDQSQYTCKHVLAVKLADLLGRVKVQTLTDEQFIFVLEQFAS